MVNATAANGFIPLNNGRSLGQQQVGNYAARHRAPYQYLLFHRHRDQIRAGPATYYNTLKHGNLMIKTKSIFSGIRPEQTDKLHSKHLSTKLLNINSSDSSQTKKPAPNFRNRLLTFGGLTPSVFISEESVCGLLWRCRRQCAGSTRRPQFRAHLTRCLTGWQRWRFCAA